MLGMRVDSVWLVLHELFQLGNLAVDLRVDDVLNHETAPSQQVYDSNHVSYFLTEAPSVRVKLPWLNLVSAEAQYFGRALLHLCRFLNEDGQQLALVGSRQRVPAEVEFWHLTPPA